MNLGSSSLEVSVFLPVTWRQHTPYKFVVLRKWPSRCLVCHRRLLPSLGYTPVRGFSSQRKAFKEAPGGKGASLGAQMVKDLPAVPGDPASIPGLGWSPGEGNGNPLQCSCLENPMDRGAWQAIVHGVAKSWTRLKDKYTHTQLNLSLWVKAPVMWKLSETTCIGECICLWMVHSNSQNPVEGEVVLLPSHSPAVRSLTPLGNF